MASTPSYPIPLSLLLSVATVLGAAIGPARAAEPAVDEWPQFGGPTRDFRISGELAEFSPEGPREIWRRQLGEGYSSVAVADGVLYTMLRDGDDELIVALDADSGTTLWEHRYAEPVPEWVLVNQGTGPHSTPLILSDRLFVVGVRGAFFCLDRASGEVLWRRELVDELGGTRDDRGYASSPLAFEGLVIVPVGGEGRALVAFTQSDGVEVWRSGDFEAAPASPSLIELDGQTQLVAFVSEAVAGFIPRSGELLWQHTHEGKGNRHINTPLWCGAGRLFITSSWGGGSRLLELERSGSSTQVNELWFTNEVRVAFSNVVRRGDLLFGSSGETTAPLAAVEIATGEVVWRDRSFGRANLVEAGARTLLFDEHGVLALVTLSRDGLEVHSQKKIVDELVRTPPTVVGSRVFIRTRTQLVALDLSAD